MALMEIEHAYFTDRDEVMADIAQTGYWPTTYVSGKSAELPLHYHNIDIIGYVIEGSTYLLNEKEEKVTFGPGARLNIPKGAWHAEGEVIDQVTYIVTMAEPKPFFEALMPQEPKGPLPPLG